MFVLALIISQIYKKVILIILYHINQVKKKKIKFLIVRFLNVLYQILKCNILKNDIHYEAFHLNQFVTIFFLLNN